METLRVRPAAKAIITDKDDENLILFVTSKSRLSLPGGGIDNGEDSDAALARELDEEIKVTQPDGGLAGLSKYITKPTRLLEVKGIVTPRKGPNRIAHWFVDRARLEVPSEQLALPNTQEIRGIPMMTAAEYVAYPEDESSLLAKAAVAAAFGIELELPGISLEFRN